MKILQFSTCYKKLRNTVLERSDRLFNLDPWEVKVQSPEFEVSFKRKFQKAGYNQTLVALGLGFVFAFFLELNYQGVYGWPTPTSVLRGLIVLCLGLTFVLLVAFEGFSRKYFEAIVGVTFTIILMLLCGLAINLPHEGIQLLATIPNILLTYLFLFGFARIPITVSVPVSLCAVPLAILVLQSHEQPMGAQIGSALNLVVFILAGALLSKSIERRERALHIATFRSEASKIKQTRDIGHVLHDLRNPLLAVELTLSGMRAESDKRFDLVTVQMLPSFLE
jgi:signal transduction histidine kinase